MKNMVFLLCSYIFNYASEFLRIWNQFTFQGTLQKCNFMGVMNAMCHINQYQVMQKLGNCYVFKPVKNIKTLDKN